MRFKLLNKIAPSNRILYRAETIADAVLSLDEQMGQKTDLELRNRVAEIIEALANGAIMEHFLVEALAIIRETMFRVHGMKAYRVQLIGAIIVNFGDFAEMMTGEGKTLTLVLAAFVDALYKKGVHIVTVNEYLVQRDAEFAAQALNKLGISCGYITSAMDSDFKRTQYACDVTYVPNSELGFDYLRDNMVKRYEDKVQRGLYFAIVDEADSVLIDEARTPLIIAGSPDADIGDYIRADSFVKSLDENDYIIDRESNSINLSEYGVDKAQAFFKVQNIYDFEFSEIVHKINNALRANKIFNNGVEYIVRKKKDDPQKDEIVLVDQFTGRIMEGRSYSAGLQQAIQAKEYVEIEPENLTVATITYQSLFRMYQKLAGVSGTAYTEAEEILNIYNMVVVRIPTNKPVIRVDQPDYIFETKKTKWKYVVAEIKKRHKTGQPILVGTASVEDSEVLHLLLQRLGIPHVVLNAKNNAMEADIIKNAGQRGNVTIATYMAGRGTDIKLGDGVRELGGLYVIGTERNESRRVDNQLRGRAGRQGDPGESRFFISLQDSLFKRFASNKLGKADNKIDDENSVIDTRFFSRLLNNTQKKVEGLNYDTRKSLIDYDYVLSAQRELFYKQRDKILLATDLKPIIFRMMTYVIDDVVQQNIDEVNRDSIHIQELITQMNDQVFGEAYLSDPDSFSRQIDALKEELLSQTEQFILRKEADATPEIFQLQIKQAIIQSMDNGWTQHLDLVGKLKDSVNLRAYEQKSPLNIYVEDADKLFHKMVKNIAFFVIKTIAQMQTPLLQNPGYNPFENLGLSPAPGSDLGLDLEGAPADLQVLAEDTLQASEQVVEPAHLQPNVAVTSVLALSDAQFYQRLVVGSGSNQGLQQSFENVIVGDSASSAFDAWLTKAPMTTPPLKLNGPTTVLDADEAHFLQRISQNSGALRFLQTKITNIQLPEGDVQTTTANWSSTVLDDEEAHFLQRIVANSQTIRFLQERIAPISWPEAVTPEMKTDSAFPHQVLDNEEAHFLQRLVSNSQKIRFLQERIAPVTVQVLNADPPLFQPPRWFQNFSTTTAYQNFRQVYQPSWHRTTLLHHPEEYRQAVDQSIHRPFLGNKVNNHHLPEFGPGRVEQISHPQDRQMEAFLNRMAKVGGVRPLETPLENVQIEN